MQQVETLNHGTLLPSGGQNWQNTEFPRRIEISLSLLVLNGAMYSASEEVEQPRWTFGFGTIPLTMQSGRTELDLVPPAFFKALD